MKTIEGADRVIAEMNGKKVAGFTVTIEKRLNDPTAEADQRSPRKSSQAANHGPGPGGHRAQGECVLKMGNFKKSE